MKNTYIVCHMLVSIDGKVTGDFLKNSYITSALDQYYKIHREYNFDAFACGRITMESSFTNGNIPDLSKFTNISIDYNDFIAEHKANKYAISFDRKGKLGWKEGILHDEDEGYNNRHIIEILTKQASTSYLAYLRTIGVSYIIAGDDDINFEIALNKLYNLFNIKTILLEGGSIINGAFMKNNLIDELSLVVAPISGATYDKPLFYESIEKCFKLTEVKKLDDNNVYLRYKKTNQ